MNNEKIKEVLEWLICIIIAITISLICRYFIFETTMVKQTSMYPTLEPDERLVLNRFNRNKDFKRGEIVTFEAPSTIFLNEDEAKENVIARYENEPQKLISKFTYHVLEINNIRYIKRVIGLPNEHIKIKDGKVYINEKLLDESLYLKSGIYTDSQNGFCLDLIVPENTVFLIGDNRTGSTDSRCFGCIPFEKIEGRVAIRIWPFSKFGNVI